MADTKRRVLPFGEHFKAKTDVELRRKSTKAVVSSPSPWRTWNGGASHWAKLQGMQETTSENHNFHKHKSFVFEGDMGGDFTMSKREASTFHQEDAKIVWAWEDGDPVFGNSDREFRYVYNGPILTDGVSTKDFPPFASSSDLELNFWGTKAVALSAPTNSVASTAVALLEAYKDGLPHLLGHSLWRDKTLAAKNAGDEYLNYQFGWLPLLSDVKDFIKGIHVFNKRYEQFVTDSGKGVRRKFAFAPESHFDETTVQQTAWVGGPSYVALQLLWNNGQVVDGHHGSILRMRETTVKRWFSGMFTYHVPAGFAGANYGGVISKARQVFDLNLTPDVLWSIAPWSWAVDWFTSTGDIIHNLTAYSKYGLVLRYGYIMEHSIVRDTYTHVGDLGLRAGNNFTGLPSPIVLTSERKLRRKATPFGFGVDLSALSGTQKAIIAALGLGRVHL